MVRKLKRIWAGVNGGLLASPGINAKVGLAGAGGPYGDQPGKAPQLSGMKDAGPGANRGLDPDGPGRSGTQRHPEVWNGMVFDGELGQASVHGLRGHAPAVDAQIMAAIRLGNHDSRDEQIGTIGQA